MASIEEWADRLSKIRRGLDPDQPEMDPEWMKQLNVLDLIRKGGNQPLMRDGVNLSGRDPIAESQASAPAGTLEEGKAFAREIPQDQSKSAKVQRAMKIIQNIMGGGSGSDDLGEDQGDSSGLHDYERAPAPKTYPSGRIGKVAKGMDKATEFLRGIMGAGSGPASARDYELVEEGEQPNRGAGAIMGNISRIGARRRVGEEKLTHARQEHAVNIDYKKAQAEQARGRGEYWGGRTATDQRKNDIAEIRANAYAAKSEADIDRLDRQLQVNQQNSLTRMEELKVSIRNATSTEERDRLMDIHRQEEQNYRAGEDIKDHLDEKRRIAVSEGNLDVSRGNLDISRQKLPGELRGQEAGLNKTIADSARLGPDQQRLLDVFRETQKENARKDIMDRYKFQIIDEDQARKELDDLDKKYAPAKQGGFSVPSFGVPSFESRTPSPNVYAGEDSNYPARSKSSKGPAKRTGNEPVTFVDANGQELVLTPAEAKRVEALIRSGQMKGWRKR